MHLIRIRIQPDAAKTLSDPGCIIYHHTVSSEQYWGILTMSLVLLGADEDHIEINDFTGLMSTRLKRLHPNGIRMKLAYLSYAKGNFILSYDPVYQSERGGDNWIEYFNTYQRHVPVPELQGNESPSEVSNREAELYHYFTEYFCRLIGRGDMIVRFRSLEFLQGAIAVCNWLGVSPTNHIYFVHHKTKRINIVP